MAIPCLHKVVMSQNDMHQQPFRIKVKLFSKLFPSYKAQFERSVVFNSHGGDAVTNWEAVAARNIWCQLQEGWRKKKKQNTNWKKKNHFREMFFLGLSEVSISCIFCSLKRQFVAAKCQDVFI